MRALCHLTDLPDATAIGFPGMVAIRLADCVLIYLNACPHLGVPLDWLPGRFMSNDGTRLVCATHGAEFRPSDGLCLRGPCRGESLTRVPAVVRDGCVYVPTQAGRQADQGSPWPDKERE
jgi:nitrite reductase/ring-hydroxylating ferredoxin subunit